MSGSSWKGRVPMEACGIGCSHRPLLRKELSGCGSAFWPTPLQRHEGKIKKKKPNINVIRVKAGNGNVFRSRDGTSWWSVLEGKWQRIWRKICKCYKLIKAVGWCCQLYLDLFLEILSQGLLSPAALHYWAIFAPGSVHFLFVKHIYLYLILELILVMG